jgi:hypothetical protein
VVGLEWSKTKILARFGVGSGAWTGTDTGTGTGEGGRKDPGGALCTRASGLWIRGRWCGGLVDFSALPSLLLGTPAVCSLFAPPLASFFSLASPRYYILANFFLLFHRRTGGFCGLLIESEAPDNDLSAFFLGRSTFVVL